MAYSKEIYEKALNEIKKRRNDAEYEASQHKQELTEKYPEFAFIEAELAKTGREILGVFALPKEQADKKLQEIRKKNSEIRNSRTELLKSMGLPENYLDVNYTCTKCEDRGFIEERNDEKGVSYGTKYCTCHLELLKKLASEKMSKSTPLELSSFEDFDLEYYSKREENGESPYREMQRVYKSCISYAENFDLESQSLYFFGRTGLGKTHLSLAIANEAIKKGYNVIYGSVIGFLNKMEREKFGRAETFETEDILIDADLLILDDLGAEFQTAFTTSAIYNLINSRIARGVPTIISSNLSIKELKERYPESVASRIIGNFATVEFIGSDIRQIMNEE